MTQIAQLLGDKADYLLNFKNPKISKDRLHVPGPDFVDRIYSLSDRNNRVLVNLQRMFGHGRLAGTGYLSILPVDQGIEHSAGASFAKNPDYFDAENIVKLAVEGGCNAVASTYGVLGAVARKYAHKIPFLVKINHNELLTYPNKSDQIMFGTIKQAADMGARRLARRFISAPTRAAGRLSRSRRRSRTRTRWAWPRCCGAIFATTLSRSRARTANPRIITSRPT